jgi:hypothetical protein
MRSETPLVMILTSNSSSIFWKVTLVLFFLLTYIYNLICYYLENKIKNIPYKHYGSEDKLVFDVNTNEFTWKKLPNPPPKKPQQVASTPFELNESRCADYLKELNLNGELKKQNKINISKYFAIFRN